MACSKVPFIFTFVVSVWFKMNSLKSRRNFNCFRGSFYVVKLGANRLDVQEAGSLTVKSSVTFVYTEERHCPNSVAAKRQFHQWVFLFGLWMMIAVVRDDLRVLEQPEIFGLLRHYSVTACNCWATFWRHDAHSKRRQLIITRYGAMSKTLKPILCSSEVWNPV